MILQIHGGPHTQYGAGFFHEFQWLAGKGYVILFTNPVGSQGRGEAYMQGLRRKWGEADFPELMAFVDALLAEGYVDEKRMGVAGGSYGGYMTNWVVGNTTRFAAACTQRCVSNLVSFAGNSDFPCTQRLPERLGGARGAVALSLCVHGSVRTPLPIIHAEAIHNVSSRAGLLALRARRKTKFVRFLREAEPPACWRRAADRGTTVEAIGDWFDEHVAQAAQAPRKTTK